MKYGTLLRSGSAHRQFDHDYHVVLSDQPFVFRVTEAVGNRGDNLRDPQVSLKVIATEKGYFRATCEKKGGSILSGPLEGFSRDEAISRIYVWASA